MLRGWVGVVNVTRVGVELLVFVFPGNGFDSDLVVWFHVG